MNATQEEASLALPRYFREQRTFEFYVKGDTDVKWSLRETTNQEHIHNCIWCSLERDSFRGKNILIFFLIVTIFKILKSEFFWILFHLLKFSGGLEKKANNTLWYSIKLVFQIKVHAKPVTP